MPLINPFFFFVSFLVSMWVVVMNIVNPSHFYVQYLAEATEIMTLSKKISYFCSKKSSCFTSKDVVETGALFFYTLQYGKHKLQKEVEGFQMAEMFFKSLLVFC